MAKSWLKTMALMLITTILVGLLVGCESKGTSSSDSANKTETSTTEDSTQTKQEEKKGSSQTDASTVAGIEGFVPFEKQVEIEIPVYDRSIEGLPPVDDNYWTRWVQSEFGDKYNIKVTYVAIPRSDEVTKFNMLIAAGTSPDIVFHYDYPQAVTYAEQGALQEIDMELFKHIAPTYYQNMVDNDILKYCELNGKNMFVMARRPEAYNYVTLIRQDWIEAVGMEMPENYEEYCALLDAWKAEGICEYPVALSLPTSGYVTNHIYRDFPLDEKELALYSDLTVASLPWEPTYKLLKRQNEEYNKGYINPEYYLDSDGSQAKADFIAGKVGIYGNYLSHDSDYVLGLMENFPDAELAVLSPYATLEEGQVPASRAYWPFGMIIGFSSQSSPEEVKATMMLLEWMSQEENLFTLQNGIEGLTYELDENGLPVMKEYTGEERMNYNSNKDMYCLVIEGKDYGSEEANLQVQKTTFAPPGFEYLIEQNYKYITETKKYSYPDYLFSTSIPEVAEYSATLLSKWQEYSVALTTCKPEEFDALYEQFSKEYLEAGYQEILDARLAAYEKDQ